MVIDRADNVVTFTTLYIVETLTLTLDNPYCNSKVARSATTVLHSFTTHNAAENYQQNPKVWKCKMPRNISFLALYIHSNI